MSSTIWSPLKTESSTRLLTLLPGSQNDLICCRLKEVDLEDNPEYEAISYTWGNAANQQIIDVNGVQVHMRFGLYCFLQKLRHSSEERVFWVDALSISQIDLDEKSRQVARIARIFKQATCVRAWVGEHADNSQILFTGHSSPEKVSLSSFKKFAVLLRRLCHLLFLFCTGAGMLLGLLSGGLISKAKGLRVGVPVGCGIFAFYALSSATLMMLWEPLSQRELSFRTPEWRAFINRLYWRRTWIVQEIAQARCAFVHCGHGYMEWSHLIDRRIEYNGSDTSALTNARFMPNRWRRPTDGEVVLLNVLRRNPELGPKSVADLALRLGTQIVGINVIEYMHCFLSKNLQERKTPFARATVFKFQSCSSTFAESEFCGGQEPGGT